MPEAGQTTRQPIPLEPFEGIDVIGAKIKITNAGDGLSEALGVEPQAFHLGEKLYVVLEVEVAKVQHVEAKDTNSLLREHTLKAQAATIVDATLVGDLVDAQKMIIRRAKEQAAGIEPLPFDDNDDDSPGPLHDLKTAQLRELADANLIDYPKSATKTRLIELLSEVPGIDDVARSFATVPDSSEASVTSIADRQTDSED
jgi:hypothetical protein